MPITIPMNLISTLKVLKVSSLSVFQPLCDCVPGTHSTKFIHKEMANLRVPICR